MGFWNNNDREESKPVWLTAAQKRWCIRTNSGWEAPTQNGIANLAGQFEGSRDLSVTGAYPVMELLVAIPNDPGTTAGSTASAYADRISITGGWTGGTHAGANLQDNPYMSSPFQGDGATAGGQFGTGLSHSCTANYGLNEFGVSSLFWGIVGRGLTESMPGLSGVGYVGYNPGGGYGFVSRNANLTGGTDGNGIYGWSVTGAIIPAGHTGYIKVKGNDANFIQSLTLSLTGQLTGGGPQTHAQAKSIVLATGLSLLVNSGPTGVPNHVYEAFFGPTSAYNQDIGVIVLPAGLTTGVYGMTAFVNDGTTAANPSATGSAAFRVTVR